MATAVVFTEIVSAVADFVVAEDEEVENCSIEARKSSTVVKALATGGFGSRLGRAALAIKIVMLLHDHLDTVYKNMKTLLKPNSWTYRSFCA